MEGAPGYFKNLEEAVYKKHIVRKQIGDFQPPIPAEGVHKMARYAYAITYVEDDEADVLPVNFESAMSRHLSLRKSTASLSSAVKAEFSKRLSQGVKRGFWSIQEVDKMRALGSGAHFLPAGFVLKDPAGSASTKVRLVLDPSQAFNGRLLAPFNAESTLASVLHKLQALPVVAVQDIETSSLKEEKTDKESSQPKLPPPVDWLRSLYSLPSWV